MLGKRYYLVIHKGNNEGFELEGDIMQLTCKDESRVVSVFETQAKEMLMSIFSVGIGFLTATFLVLVVMAIKGIGKRMRIAHQQ